MSCIPPAYAGARAGGRCATLDLVSDDTEWYWDLERKVAVPASERGPADHLLGPYPSRFDAENWKAKVEQRNEGWDEADKSWHEGSPSDPTP